MSRWRDQVKREAASNATAHFPRYFRVLYGLDLGLGILRHYSRNSRYDTVTTVRKYNLISEVHKETRTSFDRLRPSASERTSERVRADARAYRRRT